MFACRSRQSSRGIRLPPGPLSLLLSHPAASVSLNSFSMAWQRPSCIVQAMQSLRLQPLRSSASPLSPTPTQFLLRSQKANARGYATETSSDSSVQVVREAAPAAPAIDFDQFPYRPARIVPASPSYFSGSPKFIDHLLRLENLLAENERLPKTSPMHVPRKAWLKLAQFRDFVGEPVPTKKYKSLIKILQRINRIRPEIIPDYANNIIKEYVRPGNPYGVKPAPPTLDEMGRARGRGKRKTSSAVVYLVEGEGEVLVNGKTLSEAFPREHDRESVVWPLSSTERLDKYNVWATAKGGGTTGQAESITLALARALLVHEPGLKQALRKGMFFPLFMKLPSTNSITQLVRLPSTLVVWKERSPVMSRPARSPPGSSGKGIRMSFMSFPFFLAVLLSRVFDESISCIQKAPRTLFWDSHVLW